MKRWMIIVFLALMLLAAGCKNAKPDQSTTTSTESSTVEREETTAEDIRKESADFVLILSDGETWHQEALRLAVEDEMTAQELEPAEHLTVIDPDGDALLQEKQLETALQSADVVIVSAIDAKELSKIALNKPEGTILIGIDWPEEIPGADISVISQPETLASVTTEAMARELGEQGEVLFFEEGCPYASLEEVLEKLTKTYPDITVKEYIKSETGTKEEALMTALHMLREMTEIVAVVADTDQAADVFGEAVYAAGKSENVAVFSLEGGSIREAIMEGRVRGSATYFYGEKGMLAVRDSVSLLSGKETAQVERIPVQWMSEENCAIMGVGDGGIGDLTEELEFALREYERKYPGDVIRAEERMIFPNPTKIAETGVYLIRQGLTLYPTVLDQKAVLIYAGGLGDAVDFLHKELKLNAECFCEGWELKQPASESYKTILKRLSEFYAAHREKVWGMTAFWWIDMEGKDQAETVQLILTEEDGKPFVMLQCEDETQIAWLEEHLFYDCEVTYTFAQRGEGAKRSDIPVSEWTTDSKEGNTPEEFEVFVGEQRIAANQGFLPFFLWNRSADAYYELIDDGCLEYKDRGEWKRVPLKHVEEPMPHSVLYGISPMTVSKCLLNLGLFSKLSAGEYRFVFQIRKEKGGQSYLIEVPFKIEEAGKN